MSDKLVLRLERGFFTGNVIGVEFAKLEKIRIGQEVGRLNPHLQTESIMSLQVQSVLGVEEWSVEEAEFTQPYPRIHNLIFTGHKS